MEKIFLLMVILVLCIPVMAFAGQATLTWDAPTTNTNGTPLTDLAGYKVYCGTAAGSYSAAIDAKCPGGCALLAGIQYTVPGLLSGTKYYCAVTAYDLDGNESGYSNEVSKAASVDFFVVTATASMGGTISPGGAVSVQSGSAQTFTISANKGASILDVKVDGVSVGKVATYSFTNVAANHTISVTFKQPSAPQNLR